MEAAPGAWVLLVGLLCCLAAHLLSSPGYGPGVQLLLTLFSSALGVALPPGSLLPCCASIQGQWPVRPLAFLFSAGIVSLPPPDVGWIWGT